MPRDRFGGLPYPGLFSHYDAADPNRLGVHRYGNVPRLPGSDETSSGIIYTTRAGFLDVAHIRITVDTVRYCVMRLRAAVDRGEAVVPIKTLEGSTFRVTLRYPADWSGAPEGSSQRALADRVILRAGQRIAYEMMTWHEIVTWFGYRTVLFVDEQPSAFSYDDTTSNVVGLRISEAVLGAPTTRPYDQAVTSALQAQLAELGAGSPAQTDAAAAAVEGVWWAHGRPLRRQVDVGLDGVHRPWLISAVTRGQEEKPAEFRLPSLHDVDGKDFSSFASVAVEPGILEARAMRAQLPTHPPVFDVERDFPALVSAVRSQMQAKWGRQVDSPEPAPDALAATGHPHLAADSRAAGPAGPAGSDRAQVPDRANAVGGRLSTTRGTHG